MAAELICAECGAPLPENAPGNRCPKCLLQLALDETGNDAEPPNASAPGGAAPHEAPGPLTKSDRVEERIGTSIGRYKLLQQIGEGGFGVVFMAQQIEPVQRKVALKVIKAGMDTREVTARFEAERQALAMMDHPNIARVLDGGTTATRRPYFVMELVRGIPLTDYCDQSQLSTRERLELFVKVCRAVQHAHQKGVIHRDLKPTNVLVTLHDGEAVPKVIDFGVAKALGQKLTEKTLFTRFEQMIGTPAYMSPEQAALGGLDIDTRSDIYSLGVLLYELLTGVTPLDAETLRKGALDEIRRMIRETDPPKPSTRLTLQAVSDDRAPDRSKVKNQKSKIPADLDWITMKCLEKDRQRRYETVNGLARDIERHLNNEPVLARPPSRFYEFQKTVRRHKFGFAAAAAVAAALSGGVVTSTWEAARARRAEREHSRLRQEAEQARNQIAISAGQMEIREIGRAEEWLAQGDSAKGLSHLALVLRQDPSNDIAAQRLMSALSQLWFARASLAPLRHNDRLTWAQFSKDGRYVVTTSADATARVWDSATGQPVAGPFQHEQEINSADFSPDGQRLATASMDKSARVWDIPSGKPLTAPLAHQADVWNVHFSPDGERVVTASLDGTARVWEASSGRTLQTLRCGDSVPDAEFSPNGERVLTASHSGLAEIWDSSTGKLLVKLTHTDAVVSARFSPDGELVVTGCKDGTARIWDARTGQLVCPVMRHSAEVGATEFSPDGSEVATASYDGTAGIWDVHTGLPIGPPLKHGQGVRSAHFSRDGWKLVTTSWDNTARIWDVRTGTAITQPLMHEAHVFWAEFDPSGQRLLTVSNGKGAQIWDTTFGPARPKLARGHGVLISADFSNDGQLVVLTSGSGARIWDLGSPGALKTIVSDRAVNLASFSHNGRWLVTAEANGQAQVWDPHSAVAVGPPLVHGTNVLLARFSPDARWVMTASSDSTARVWDRQTSQPVTPPLEYKGRIIDGQFSPDGLRLVTASGDEFDFTTIGHRVVTASGDHAARLWDATSGQQLLFLQHPAELRSVQFSPDGQLILTTCSSTVHVWDAHAGRERFPPFQQTDGVVFASFSPDGRRIVTGSAESSIRILDALTGNLLAINNTSGLCAQLSADGNRFVTVGGGEVRVFDMNTCLPLTDVLRQPTWAGFAAFSPDGNWVLTTPHSGSTAFLWDVHEYPVPVPTWVPELAEALSGQAVDVLGRSHFVPPERILKIKDSLEQLNPPNEDYLRWANWFFAEERPRAISPALGQAGKLPLTARPQVSRVPTKSQLFDLARDFSTQRNPSGVWSYGYSHLLGGPLVLYTHQESAHGVSMWLRHPGWPTPSAYHNGTLKTIVGGGTGIHQAGMFGLHPYKDEAGVVFAVARFTVPATGLYGISGSFFGQDTEGTTTDVHILTNSVSLFEGEVAGFGPGSGPGFHLALLLRQNDCLDFVVGPGLGDDPDHDSTGLSVQIVANIGRVTMPGLFNTGVSQARSVLAPNELESHYRCVPGSVITGWPIAVEAFNQWLEDNNTSAWIAPTNEPSVPAGIYRYETEFDLTGLNPITAIISGRWSSDNVGLDILINGNSTGQINILQFTAWTPFTVTNGFVAGRNRLTFLVENTTGDPNPSGLRVEMSGTAEPREQFRADTNPANQ